MHVDVFRVPKLKDLPNFKISLLIDIQLPTCRVIHSFLCRIFQQVRAKIKAGI